MSNRLEHETVLGIIEKIYAAGCRPELWPDVAASCQKLFPGCGFSVLLSNPANDLDGISTGAGYDPKTIEDYIAHFHAMNPYLPIVAALPSDKVARASELVTRDWLMDQPFYHEWLKPAGEFVNGVTLPIRRNGGDHLLRLTYDIPAARADAEELAAEFLRIASSHFRRAFEISWRLRQAGEMSNLGQSLLAKLQGAVMIVDGSSKIAGANSAAVTLLREGRVMRAPGDRLTFVAARAEEQFQRVLRAATAVSGTHAPNGFLVDIDGVPTPVVVLPIVRTSTGFAEYVPVNRLALVQVCSSTSSPLPADLLRSLYNLTRAEALVVQRVAAGDSIKEIADANENSQSTVRNQLQAAMQKLGVHRQAELVGFLAGLTPRLSIP